MRFIGIDPGATGAIAIVNFNKGKITFSTLPFSKSTTEVMCLRSVFSLAVNKACPVSVEFVHAYRGQGVSSMFTFGTNYGKILGVLEYLNLPFRLVHPFNWQRPFNELSSAKLSPKKRALNNLTKIIGECKHLSDGEIDAILIAIASFIDSHPDKITKYFNSLPIIKYYEGETMDSYALEDILDGK